jgi:hypothetical protein
MAAFNFHRRKTRRWWYAGVTLVAAAFFAVFYVAGASAIGALSGSPSGFESGDGNVALDATTLHTNTDWSCFKGSTGFQTGTPDPNCKVTSGATQFTADSTADGELEIKPGSKFDDLCFKVQGGNNPPKDEWTNIAEYTEADASNNIFFYGASIRPVVNGNTSGNVYFSQTTDGCHTAGDVLLAFDFLNGGGTPSLHILRWITSGTCYLNNDSAPCWSTAATVPTSDYNGNVNTGQITDDAISGNTLPANAFAEFGINLTQAIHDAGGTAPACFASQTWVSRSSGSSFSSNPEDTEIIGRSTCGTITIIKHTLNPSGTRSPAVDQSFGYTTTGPTGSGLDGGSFSLNDKDGADTVSGGGIDTNNTKVYSGVAAGNYTVTETTPLPANFGFVSLICTANTGSSGAQDGTTPTKANITLGVSGNVTCTYTNKKLVGALLIKKESTKSGNPLVSNAGAKFCFSTTSGCTGTTSGATQVTDTTDSTGGDEDTTKGEVCVSGLAPGTYYVNETLAPAGYAGATSSNVQVSVVSGTDCGSNKPSTAAGTTTGGLATLLDPPTFSIKFLEKDDGSGETKIDSATGSFTCSAPSAAGGTVSTAATQGWDNSYAISGLKAGATTVTVTCTAVVDP